MSIDSDGELRREAEELRKSGKFKESQEKYTLLWEHSQRVLYGAGLLHCLRKLNDFDDALKLAHELESHCSELNWCKTEVVWTYISGLLCKVGESEPLEKTLDIANKIMSLGPEDVALEKTVFEVLDCAKAAGDWNVVNEWVTKISPESISSDPMKIGDGKEGWSRRAQWYNYRINSLIETDNCEDAIKIVDDILPQFPKQRKYFVRLKAVALHKEGKNDESVKIYEELCRHPKADWWLLQEYANVLRDLGKCDLSLLIYCRAAQTANKPEMMVKMVADMGFLFKNLSRNKESLLHFLTAKFIRQDSGWKIPHEIESAINELSVEFLVDQYPTDSKSALRQCRELWQKETGSSNIQNIKSKQHLSGNVLLGNPEKPFCFIESDNTESFFCYKDNLPPGIKDKMRVSFDVVPSFDKKKNRETFRATNIRILANPSHS
jgi:tetratricopeptide (TPR) repeat protein